MPITSKELAARARKHADVNRLALQRRTRAILQEHRESGRAITTEDAQNQAAREIRADVEKSDARTAARRARKAEPDPKPRIRRAHEVGKSAE